MMAEEGPDHPAVDRLAPDLAELRRRLSAEAELRTEQHIRHGRSRDASRARPEGLPSAVLFAASSDDVATGLQWASQHTVRVSVRGAGSGLSGGAVSYPEGLVISTERMDRIVEINPVDRIAVAEAGVLTSEVAAAAAEHRLFYAPDPASMLISTVGGNVATNAGGLRGAMYGATKDHVLGLTVVTAEGLVLRTGGRTRKNSTGYDLTSLFIGSEGTLGVVTEVTMRLLPMPVGGETTFQLSFGKLTMAAEAVAEMMTSPVTPVVLELLDEFTVRAIQELRGHAPTGEGAVLIGRVQGSDHRAQWEILREIAGRHGLTEAAEGGDDLLETRRVMTDAVFAKGLKASCDVAVPVSQLGEMCRAIARIEAEEDTTVAVVAHAADGNLHPVVSADPDNPDDLAFADHILHRITEAALELGGVISGEHGIGSLKQGDLALQFTPAEFEIHHRLKAALDPHGILTPGRGI